MSNENVHPHFKGILNSIGTVVCGISEKEILEATNEMCIESLSPENFEKWEDVKAALKLVRKGLAQDALPGQD